MILIVSNDDDDHARAVIESLRRRKSVAVQLLDLSRFPKELHLGLDYEEGAGPIRSWFRNDREAVSVSNCSVVWWRRPQPFSMHEELLDPSQLSFAHTECYEAVNGLWLTFPATWVNHPSRDEEAARKPYQLRIAREVGFEIPRTRITSDPAAAAQFVEELGSSRTIYKAFTGTEQVWRETRVLRENEVALLDDVQFAPVIFQEYIPAQLDLRITVIGDEIHASAIHSAEGAYQADYRMELSDARVETFTLPSGIQSLVRAYMRRLGLLYGAVDIRVTPEGRYVFLEINPSGQWLFMEERTGAPMTEAFTSLLVREHEKRAGAGA